MAFPGTVGQETPFATVPVAMAFVYNPDGYVNGPEPYVDWLLCRHTSPSPFESASSVVVVEAFATGSHRN